MLTRYTLQLYTRAQNLIIHKIISKDSGRARGWGPRPSPLTRPLRDTYTQRSAKTRPADHPACRRGCNLAALRYTIHGCVHARASEPAFARQHTQDTQTHTAEWADRASTPSHDHGARRRRQATPNTETGAPSHRTASRSCRCVPRCPARLSGPQASLLSQPRTVRPCVKQATILSAILLTCPGQHPVLPHSQRATDSGTNSAEGRARTWQTNSGSNHI